MRWKIGQFIFCEKSQTLTDGRSRVVLEPLSVEVLAYFCRNPNIMISRDLLITEVWNGRIVTDNAVTRVITKLRKALADTADAPRFIATFPKKGYKFVADVALFDEHAEKQHDIPVMKAFPSHATKWRLSFALLVFAAFSACLWFLLPGNISTTPSLNSQSYYIDALTRGADREFHPAISPDNRYLLFSSFAAGRMRLWLKDLATEETVEIGDQDGWSGPASWSSDGKQIVYLNTTIDACRYFLVNVTGLKVGKRQLIHNCPKGSHGKIIFGHDKHTFIYAESPGAMQPFSIFEFNTNTGRIRRLPQPELILGGNSQFDLHPTENKLLISSPNAKQWLDIYSLDLTSNELHYLFELSEYTCCAIWDHSGERVVIQGEHPAKELISFDLDGKNRAVLFQVPLSVSAPVRIPHNSRIDGNRNSYAYVGGEINRDIYVYAFDSSTSKVIIYSTVDDWLPTVSRGTNTLAFISDRSGNEEIWIRKQGQSFERKLTSYKDGRHYFDLQWSPDGKWIAGMTINEIHLTDANTGNWRKLKILQEELTGISWKDNQTLSFSVNASGKWQVKLYNILNDQLKNAPGDWQFVRHAPNSRDSLWVDQEDALFYGNQLTPLELTSTRVLQNRRFNVVKVGDSVYYTADNADRSQLIQHNVNTLQSVALFAIDAGVGVSVGESGVFYSQLTKSDTNIYRVTKNN